MPARKPDPEGYYHPQGTFHYNVCFVGGHVLNRVTQRDLAGFRHQDIDFVWIVEEKRRATPEEIRSLCKAKRTSR